MTYIVSGGSCLGGYKFWDWVKHETRPLIGPPRSHEPVKKELIEMQRACRALFLGEMYMVFRTETKARALLSNAVVTWFSGFQFETEADAVIAGMLFNSPEAAMRVQTSFDFDFHFMGVHDILALLQYRLEQERGL